MIFALALLFVTVAVLGTVLSPLWQRAGRPVTRARYDRAVYRDQLAEIERDVGRGVLEPGDAEMAKAEIGRRILALTPVQAPAASPRTPLAFAMIAVILVPFAAWTLYWDLGAPNLPDEPHDSVAAGPHLDINDALKQLAAHLADHPDDLKGWLLLARTERDLGRYSEAADGYRHAVELSNQNPEIAGDWGEAQILAANGTVTPSAVAAFKIALADSASAPRSRFYLALADYQAGDVKKALQEWVDLEADSPADATWMPMLRKQIADAAKSLGVDPATLKTSAGAPRKAAETQSPSR